MLVLTRSQGQSIIIGDHVIKITVLGAMGQVKIGVDAPKDVEVHREEVFNRIQLEKNGVEINGNK